MTQSSASSTPSRRCLPPLIGALSFSPWVRRPECAGSGLTAGGAQDRAGPGAPKGIPRHRSKEVLDVKMWDKIEATPHGKAAEMFAAQTSGVEKPMSKTQSLSVPRVNHYDVSFDKQGATHELHGYYGTKGRKTFDNANESFAID